MQTLHRKAATSQPGPPSCETTAPCCPSYVKATLIFPVQQNNINSPHNSNDRKTYNLIVADSSDS